MTYIYIAALRLRRSEPVVSDAYSQKSLAIYMYVAAMAGAVSDFGERWRDGRRWGEMIGCEKKIEKS